MQWPSLLIKALIAYLHWKAAEAKSKTIYGTHDRFEVQKNRVKQIRKDLFNATGRGVSTNDLRMLENELAVEQRYLRTLENHLARWQDSDD